MKTTKRFSMALSLAIGLATVLACTPPPPTGNSNRAGRNSNAQSNGNASQGQSASTAPAQKAPASGGTIEIKSTPSGAAIFLVPIGEDEAGAPQQYGLTPATINVPPGKYLINLEVSGYKAFQKSITAEQGKTMTVNATLKKR